MIRALLLVAVVLPVGCAAQHAQRALDVPLALQSCGHPAAVPPLLPRIVTTVQLRQAYQVSEAARVRDHLVAVECSRALRDVLDLITAYNAGLSARGQ